MDRRGTDHPFVRDRQFAVAARRLRSSETGVHFVRNGQGWPLALSAHAARTSGDKAAPSRLVFSRAFRGDAIVGNRVAVSVAYRCARASIRVIPAAKEAYGKVAAVIAVGAFGLNLLSPRLATLVRTDMPLALVIFLIGR